jgi:hypothetical protein
MRGVLLAKKFVQIAKAEPPFQCSGGRVRVEARKHKMDAAASVSIPKIAKPCGTFLADLEEMPR